MSLHRHASCLRTAMPALLLLPLVACDGRAPNRTGPSATSFLTGTWSGTLTIQINPGDPDAPPPTSGAVTWTFEVVPQTNLQTFTVTIRSQHAWLPIETTGSTALTPGNTPPVQISTQGEFDSPRGCRGTFGSVGTAQATRIEADFTGTDCNQTTFTGSVVLTKG
jgi:hypothetical protein